MKHLTTPERSTPVQPSPALTDRELDVVRLVAVTRTNAEIAAELFVSLSTVKTHLSRAQLKPDARNRVEIAAWAWQSGTRNLTDGARRGGCPVRRFHRRHLLAEARRHTSE
ncbi:hypothetical protein GCM10010272_54030 [Streptomyces lateritius]|nr:hypothetical protein GCM10010272_54030 [Streptomyces lateritius]